MRTGGLRPGATGSRRWQNAAAFPFGEHRPDAACPADPAEACTGRPEHKPDSGHVPNVMGTWPTEP